MNAQERLERMQEEKRKAEAELEIEKKELQDLKDQIEELTKRRMIAGNKVQGTLEWIKTIEKSIEMWSEE